MKRKLCLSLCFLLLLSSVLPMQAFAGSVGNTVVSLAVREIKVNFSGYGKYSVDGVEYDTSRSFFRAEGQSITFTLIPDAGGRVNISTDSESGVTIDGNNVTVVMDSEKSITFTITYPSDSGRKPNKKDDPPVVVPDVSDDSKMNFTDVQEHNWFYDDVKFAVENELMVGVGNGRFAPHVETTRAMITAILYRLEGSPAVMGISPFEDVSFGDWYWSAVIWAEKNEIVAGYPDGTFGPNDPITREQLAAILYRYLQYKGYDMSMHNSDSIYQYSDVDRVGKWAFHAMQWACSEELIYGVNGQLLPKNHAERCQVAAILHRLCEKVMK